MQIFFSLLISTVISITAHANSHGRGEVAVQLSSEQICPDLNPFGVITSKEKTGGRSYLIKCGETLQLPEGTYEFNLSRQAYELASADSLPTTSPGYPKIGSAHSHVFKITPGQTYFVPLSLVHFVGPHRERLALADELATFEVLNDDEAQNIWLTPGHYEFTNGHIVTALDVTLEPKTIEIPVSRLRFVSVDATKNLHSDRLSPNVFFLSNDFQKIDNSVFRSIIIHDPPLNWNADEKEFYLMPGQYKVAFANSINPKFNQAWGFATKNIEIPPHSDLSVYVALPKGDDWHLRSASLISNMALLMGETWVACENGPRRCPTCSVQFAKLTEYLGTLGGVVIQRQWHSPGSCANNR